jgi:hypothetical protein
VPLSVSGWPQYLPRLESPRETQAGRLVSHKLSDHPLQNLQRPTYDSSVSCDATSFRFECEMVKPLVALLPSVFDLHTGQRARLLREQPIGSVIPDLLFGIWSGELPRYARLNTVSRHILAWLSTQKIANSEEQLRNDLLLSQYAAESAVSALKHVGAISKRDSGEVELRPEFDVSGSVRLIAIEMKLKRWREALMQAIEYRKFADEAYVVLDGNQVRMTIEVRDAFVANGIGLFLQCGAELEREVSAEPLAPPPSAERLFAVSKLTSSGPYCLA